MRFPIKLRYLLILFVIACAVLGPWGMLIAGSLIFSILKIAIIAALVIYFTPRVLRWIRTNF